MKEIGGYMQLETSEGGEYYPELMALNTARNALALLCQARNVRKLWLPYFLCDSVMDMCQREGIRHGFYSINEDFTPRFPSRLGGGEYLYIVNYYGQLSNESLRRYQNEYGRVIVDNVQAFYAKPVDGIDTIYSCRKFFGVPDGAYLAAPGVSCHSLEIDHSKDRMVHLLGRCDESNASAYHAAFKENDASFRTLLPRRMSRLTHALLSAIDYDAAKARREENWRVLDAMLGEENKLHPACPEGPYMYPFYCADGINVRKRLAEQKIYVPTLWPNVLALNNCQLEKDYAANILPLPIDQRYDEQDMQRVAEFLIREV